MKRTLKQGLESIVNSGRNIGKFIKKNAKIGLTALALPVIFTSTAKAVEGGVSIDYSISSVGGADWRLNHTLTPGVSEGLDEYDAGYEDLFPPDGVAVKAVSSVDGIEVVSDVRPSSDSPSGGGCSFSIVTDGRNVVIPEGTTHGFSVSVSGYEGCNVSVGGYNAREVGWVSLGTLPAGTYSGGLSTGSASISFSCPEPPPPPPPPPPPEPPGPEPEPPKPGPTPAGPLEELLHIKNYIDNSYSHIFKLAHKPGASEGLDNYDSLYTKSFDYWEKGSKIVSIIPSGRRSHELEFDVRPKDSTGSVYLLLSLVSQSGQPLTISSNNELRLSFPSDSHEYDFSGNPITLQQHDSFNQSATFPIYDVRQVIAKNNGIIKLDDLDGIYNSEEPYAFLELAFNEFLLSDLNKDDIIDFEDCSILADDLGKTNVNSIADISSPKGKGVPDRKVDYYDLRTFFEEWSNNWILSGDAKIITDAERGNVIEFDGDRDYAKINDLGRKLTDGFTYSACVKTYVGDDGVQRGIVSQSGSPSMVKTSDGKLGVWMDFESGAKRPCYSGEIPVNKWTYVAIAWSKESKTLKTYIDGELQCTWASPPGKELKPGSGPFYIGKTLSTNQYFNGAIDDIMIFNRALSDGEIKAISPVKAVSPVVDDNMEEFETGDFSKFDWRHYGEAYWTVTSEEAYSGTYSAQAGAIGHGENTTLERVVDCVRGYITFHHKVSSEEDFDYLRFYIDGVEQDKWSGNQHWNRVSFPVTAGTRIFEWTYSKDYSNYRGSDTAWIDNIVFIIPATD